MLCDCTHVRGLEEPDWDTQSRAGDTAGTGPHRACRDETFWKTVALAPTERKRQRQTDKRCR